MDIEVGTVTLPEYKLQDLLTLIDIPDMERRIGQKYLESLIGNFLSMYLAVPGEMAHFYHIQRTLTQGGEYKAWLSSAFYQELVDCQDLVNQTAVQPTQIICQETTHMGFCDASGIVSEGMWIKPTKSRTRIVWNHPWPSDITDTLVLDTNPGGTLTNSDQNLNALVLHKATLLAVLPNAIVTAPYSV